MPFADKQVTEITCHAKGLSSLLPSARTVVDIGGQDSKGIRMENGKVVSFVMNDKCAAGTGRFLEVIADALGIPLDKLGELSLAAEKTAVIGNMCTVFAEQEVISQLAAGEPVPNLVAGIHQAIAGRIFSLVNKLKIKPDVAITGGRSKKYRSGEGVGGEVRLRGARPPGTVDYRGSGCCPDRKRDIRDCLEGRERTCQKAAPIGRSHLFLIAVDSRQ